MKANFTLRPLCSVLLAVLAVAAPLASEAVELVEHRDVRVASNSDADLVQRAFDAWAAGTGGPYELLSDDARWTIVGRSAVAGVYPDRDSFLREVIRPFNARMRKPLKPVVRRIFTSGNTVIVLFDAKGVARDGIPYENTYTWYLTMRNGHIAESIAFFDSIAFDALWKRVTPASKSNP